jgi:hypothetical protein
LWETSVKNGAENLQYEKPIIVSNREGENKKYTE